MAEEHDSLTLGNRFDPVMRSILRSRIDKLEKAVQAEAGKPLRVWVVAFPIR